MLCIQAVVTAIEYVDGCSRHEAQHTFSMGVPYTDEEVDACWRSMYMTYGGMHVALYH